MSAIFGLIRVNGDGLPRQTLATMRSALAAHGGDGSGIWTGDRAGLGQQLKRVTPEDAFERQPLVSPDGRRILVSDGRIDNRPELAGLLALPRSSPEVPDSAFIMAAYERWGEDCARHLIGSFSFAVWDSQRRRLLLARSPFGAKPVFFHQSADFVAFATMPRALFALPGVPRKLCLSSVADYLTLVPPEPGASLFHGIRSLEPGHAVTVDHRGCRVREFWRPELRHELRLGSDEEYVAAFTELFDRVVADQLRSLTPIGVLMSGGLDSTSVAAMAAPLLARRGKRLAAFTGAPRAGYREPGAPDWLVDEAPLAGTMAARYQNIDLSVIRAEGLFLDGLDRYFEAAEMPYEGTASRVWYEEILAQAQRRGIQVLLTGKGGNFTVSWHGGGLLRSLVSTGRWPAAWREARDRAPGGRARPAARILARRGLIPQLPTGAQLAITRWRGNDDPLLAREDWWAPLSPIHPEFAREQAVAARSRARACDHWIMRSIDTPASRLRRLMHDGQHISVINGGYSARFGVDIRDPTADARIVEFCLSLPEQQYFRGGVSRSLIRRAMADRLPTEILAGARRGIDSADWFERLSGARAVVLEELRLLEHSETAAAMLDLPRMRRLADRFDTPAADPRQRMLDYRHVLERGLMTGRFLRWFDGGTALPGPVRRRAGEDHLGHLVDRPPRRGPVEAVKRHGGHDRRHQGEQRRMLLGEHRPVQAPLQRQELVPAGHPRRHDLVAARRAQHVQGPELTGPAGHAVTDGDDGLHPPPWLQLRGMDGIAETLRGVLG
jgi:asparagine synthase (glutamine-hydrolysing)